MRTHSTIAFVAHYSLFCCDSDHSFVDFIDQGTIHALRWPASEKGQCTKSREVNGDRAPGSGCRVHYGDLRAGVGKHDMRVQRLL